MRTISSALFLATSALAACGDPPTPPQKTTVELDTIGPPMLVAVREADGDWQSVALAGNRYSIEVSGPYVVAVACNDVTGLIDSYQFARTPDDETELEAPCTGEGPPLSGNAQGTLAQPGEVAVGFSTVVLDAPNSAYDIPAASGPQELVASDETRIALRRITVAGVTQVTPIDLATEGAAFVPAGITVANAGGDASTASARLITEHTTFASVSFTAELAELVLAPDSVLGANDRQRVTVTASGATSTARSVSRANVRAATDKTYTLPEALVGAAMAEVGGQVEATWGALPDHDSLSLTIDASTPDFSTFIFHDMDISKSYAAAMGTATLDLDIPGFQAAWKIDLTKEYNRELSARKDRSDEESASSRLFETLNLPPDDGKPSPRKRAQPAPRKAKLLTR